MIKLKKLKLPEDHTRLSGQPDQWLIEKYKSTSDLDFLGALYERYMPLVYGVCFKYFKEEEASKDAVMQIFEELVQKVKIYEINNFKSWLHVLTRNHCLMQLRKSSKVTQISINEENFVEKAEFLHLDIDEEKEQRLTIMEDCIKTLSEEQRITVELFYLQEKCYKDIADFTGYDLTKVKSYIQNGKRNLKICIEKNHRE